MKPHFLYRIDCRNNSTLYYIKLPDFPHIFYTKISNKTRHEFQIYPATCETLNFNRKKRKTSCHLLWGSVLPKVFDFRFLYVSWVFEVLELLLRFQWHLNQQEWLAEEGQGQMCFYKSTLSNVGCADASSCSSTKSYYWFICYK